MTTQLTAPMISADWASSSRCSITATLCGIEQLKPGPAHRPGAADGVAELRGGDLAVDVPRVDPVMAIGRLDHRDRRVLRDRRGEAAGEGTDEHAAHWALLHPETRTTRTREMVSGMTASDNAIVVDDPNRDYGDKVVAVEPGGVEFIPLDERHGTPLQLFWTWTSPNMEFATIGVGILGVAVLRADVLAVRCWRS